MGKSKKLNSQEAYRAWQKRHGLKTGSRETLSDIPIPDLNLPTELTDEYVEKLGFPGEAPFTRGIHATMYRGRLWTMRQYAGFGTAEEANKRYKYLLEQGSSGLSVAFDLPTQMGRDADHPLAKGEVGRVGVSISTIEDMQRLFDGISLEDISTSMTINATAFILLAMYLVVAEQRGTDWKSLRGTVQNDVLKEYIARGTYIYPPKGAMRIITDMFTFCQREVPSFNTISISGYHIREAGSTAVQEVAFTFANAISYVEAALARGLSVDDFAPRMAFFFNCHDTFLEEVAKFRAARRMWGVIMAERFGAKNPKSCMMRFHTQTAGSTLTAQQPLTNTVRTTMQALAAVLGGTQSLHTNSYDEALCLPTEASAKLALRTQQIIAEESGVADFVDPLAGSYAVEYLTDEIEARANALIEEIEQMGGMVAAIESGFPQKCIEEAAYNYQTRLESGHLHKVGVNAHVDEHTEELETGALAKDANLERKQQKRLAAFRNARDEKRCKDALGSLSKAIAQTGNMMEFVLEAVRAEATLGEIADVFRAQFGEYQGA